MKFSVVLICILQLIVVRSQSDSVEETTPEITIMEETTPEITTMEETTPEITIMEETTPEIITMGETTPEITIRGETTPGDETENTMISTMDTSTTTQKPDDSKHKRGLGAGIIVAIVFGCLAGIAIIGAIIYFVRQWLSSR
uniref:Uncharacterized protein n=1 Tax=Trichobilharzia regenti TaxID=157069 RepID=A0AA85IXE5_TRIRE|nr:unnamed protein product [Trichobilharzia regenti]